MSTMSKDNISNSYEEARKLRVLDNKKRFEDLGILSISKSLTEISKPEKKTTPRKLTPKQCSAYTLEPRRSSRERKPVPTYRDDVSDMQLPKLRKKSKFSPSWASYLARPSEEVKSASYEERAAAFKAAEKVQSNLGSENPSFVKSMVRSHVYSCFWLGLPSRFCEQHLPKSTVEMVLENEDGSEFESVYISKRSGLSGGWRGFALDHKLDDGDALVFELVEPTRFKVYIVRVVDESNQSKKSVVSQTSIDADDQDDENDDEDDDDDDTTKEEPTKSQKKRNTSSKDDNDDTLDAKIEETTKNKSQKKRNTWSKDDDTTKEEPTKNNKSQKKRNMSSKDDDDDDNAAEEIPTKNKSQKKRKTPSKDKTIPKTVAMEEEENDGRRRSSRRK